MTGGPTSGDLRMEEACRRGDLETIQQMWRQNPEVIFQTDAIGISLLHRVAAANHLHIARFLVGKGASVNAVDKYNDAPLKKAAFRGFSDFVVFLVLNGANVNHRDGSGKIALHHSAEQVSFSCGLFSVLALVGFP